MARNVSTQKAIENLSDAIVIQIALRLVEGYGDFVAAVEKNPHQAAGIVSAFAFDIRTVLVGALTAHKLRGEAPASSNPLPMVAPSE